MVESKSAEGLYEFHPGSIRVSGRSKVFATGLSAYHEYIKGTRPVEFVFLGGNAGQQAFKASVVTKRELETMLKKSIGFEPFWCKVEILGPDGASNGIKDASGWRVVELNTPYVPMKARVITHETAVPAQAVAKPKEAVDASKK